MIIFFGIAFKRCNKIYPFQHVDNRRVLNKRNANGNIAFTCLEHNGTQQRVQSKHCTKASVCAFVCKSHEMCFHASFQCRHMPHCIGISSESFKYKCKHINMCILNYSRQMFWKGKNQWTKKRITICDSLYENHHNHRCCDWERNRVKQSTYEMVSTSIFSTWVFFYSKTRSNRCYIGAVVLCPDRPRAYMYDAGQCEVKPKQIRDSRQRATFIFDTQLTMKNIIE